MTTIIYIPIEAYLPSEFTIVGNIGIWTSGALPLITAIAAIAFPYRQKNIFNGSPIPKYRGLLPLSGAILAILLGIVLYMYAFYPALEVSLGVTGYSIIAAELVGCAVWFFVFRAYQKSKGIDIDLGFREIPGRVNFDSVQLQLMSPNEFCLMTPGSDVIVFHHTIISIMRKPVTAFFFAEDFS